MERSCGLRLTRRRGDVWKDEVLEGRDARSEDEEDEMMGPALLCGGAAAAFLGRMQAVYE
jgi:hypothetical protein